MVKLVLLLSLLSVIIGWSEAKDVCVFSLGEGVPRPKLKTEKNNEELGEVFVEFEGMAASPRLELHFACDREISRRIMNHEHTVAFDLYFNDGIQYASVKYLNYLIPQTTCDIYSVKLSNCFIPETKYLFTQSGAEGGVAYDISGYNGFYTFIIPSNLLTGESENNSAQQYGYGLHILSKVFMDFGGLNSKTIGASELRFEYKRVTPRTHTTVAFRHKSGTITVFPSTSLKETTTVLKHNMQNISWAMVLSGEQELDGKVFKSPFFVDDKILFLDNNKATYDSPPLTPPVVNSGSPDRQSSGKKGGSPDRQSSGKKRGSSALRKGNAKRHRSSRRSAAFA